MEPNQNEKRKRSKRSSDGDEDDDLPVPWQRLQGAIWLVGLAILAWRGWWWPGILVLVAISGLFQAVVQIYLSKQEEKTAALFEVDRLAKDRASWLPSVCPNCGGPISLDGVKWTGPMSADCPYCSAHLRPTQG